VTIPIQRGFNHDGKGGGGGTRRNLRRKQRRILWEMRQYKRKIKEQARHAASLSKEREGENVLRGFDLCHAI